MTDADKLASALKELLAKVERATGADREIDVAIYRLGLPADDYTIRILDGTFSDVHDVQLGIGGVSYRTGSGGRGGAFPIPRYTSSIDAAVKLVEDQLPGRTWHVSNYFGFSTGASARIMEGLHEGSRARAEAATPALALLCALLKAKISTHGDANG